MPSEGTEIENTNAVEIPNNYLICDQSGFRVSVQEGLHEQWDGLQVRRKDFDRRHPQEFVRNSPERPKGSIRPEQPDRFIEDDIYPNGVTTDDL